MKKVLWVAAAISACAIGATGCTQWNEPTALGVSVSSIQQTVDRDEQEMGQFSLARLCELGSTVPGHAAGPCVLAYGSAYHRGDYKEALRYATVGCLRDDDEMQCRNATAPALQMNGNGPRVSRPGTQIASAV